MDTALPKYDVKAVAVSKDPLRTAPPVKFIVPEIGWARAVSEQTEMVRPEIPAMSKRWKTTRAGFPGNPPRLDEALDIKNFI